MALWAIIFIASGYFIIKSGQKLANATNALNIIAVCLVVISLANIAIFTIALR